jgi:hypothetical protein
MRTFGIVFILGVTPVLANGCGSGSPSNGGAVTKPATAYVPRNATAAPPRPEAAADSGAGAPARPAPAPAAKSAPPSPPAAGSVEAAVGTYRRPRPPQQKGPPPGTLTAGSFDDNLNPQFFRAFATRAAQLRNLGDLPSRLRGHRLNLLVKGAGGAPLGNTRVRIAATAGGPAVELTTRSDGRVVFLASWDGVAADSDLSVTVTPPDGSAPAPAVVPRGVERWEITLPAAKAPLPRNLDLALVLDTTGSMGDELEYLKSEIDSIAATVRAKFPKVNQRYALVLYRDDGDEYVTRTFDFTPSLEELRRRLAPQRAAGGGDEPEAMHRAMEEAQQLRWRGDDTARVLFVLTDAPPHAQFMGRTMNAVNGLRKQGVAVYPVACSGYKDEAEFVLRSCALLTGAEFLFLTDDSGVGNAHAEPHIPFYHVQKLDKLMGRMIAGELSGKRIPPERADVLRTVGKPIN